MTHPEADSRLPTRTCRSARSLHVCHPGRCNCRTDRKPDPRLPVNVVPTPVSPLSVALAPLKTNPQLGPRLQNAIENT